MRFACPAYKKTHNPFIPQGASVPDGSLAYKGWGSRRIRVLTPNL